MTLYVLKCVNCNEILKAQFTDQNSGDRFIKIFVTKEDALIVKDIFDRDFPDHKTSIEEVDISFK